MTGRGLRPFPHKVVWIEGEEEKEAQPAIREVREISREKKEVEMKGGEGKDMREKRREEEEEEEMMKGLSLTEVVLLSRHLPVRRTRLPHGPYQRKERRAN